MKEEAHHLRNDLMQCFPAKRPSLPNAVTSDMTLPPLFYLSGFVYPPTPPPPSLDDE